MIEDPKTHKGRRDELQVKVGKTVDIQERTQPSKWQTERRRQAGNREGLVFPLKISSFNVNRINRKQTEVRYLLQQDRLDVLCLQETQQQAAHWPLPFEGYRRFVLLREETSST